MIDQFFFGCQIDHCLISFGCFCKYIENALIVDLTYQRRYSRFDDPRLFKGDLLYCVSQELGMVETDIRNDTQDRSDDVRTVQPSAHTCFDNGKVDLFGTEVIECHSGSQFKEGGAEWFECGAVALYEIYYIFFGNHFAVDTDAFAEVDQVRRSEKPDFISCLPEDSCQ